MYGEQFESSARTALADAWGVTDKESALKVLRWLREQGHQGYYKQLLAHGAQAEQVTARAALEIANKLAGLAPNETLRPDPSGLNGQLQLARKIHQQLPRLGLVAWDAARVVQVARLGFMAGYLTDEES
nr:DUF1266 domain-containing protein [Pyxidicoccus fallax]